MMSSYGEGLEKTTRRKKLAGYLKAANDVRQSYQKSYSERWGSNFEESNNPNKISGSYPADVKITTDSNEELVIFPSYAKRCLKITEIPNTYRQSQDSSSYTSPNINDLFYQNTQNYDRKSSNIEKNRTIVDIDVRGWLYSPHRGPMTRKHKLLIGLARQIGGIHAPPASELERELGLRTIGSKRGISISNQEIVTTSTNYELLSDQSNGGKLKTQGLFEDCKKYDLDTEEIRVNVERSRKNLSKSLSDDISEPCQTYSKRSWNCSDISYDDFVNGNSNLMARLGPFMANPLVSKPVTIFFYNDHSSVSRIVETNEAGHFFIRESLNFVPTRVRVQASESLYATETVKIVEPKGVSLISDIDDTIKHTSIDSGAREAFRNAFIRDLKDLTIDGVKEWYTLMYEMGVNIHYVSNSPWQLYPTLICFFKAAGLPIGSYHLKCYSSMLQGILEPVSERKKPTITKILSDFPERYFILVGDSGEADLEVYCDVVLENPGRILMVLIRDMTRDFFDSAMNSNVDIRYENKLFENTHSDLLDSKDKLSVRSSNSSKLSSQIVSSPIMTDLIELSRGLKLSEIKDNCDKESSKSNTRDEIPKIKSIDSTPKSAGKRAPPPKPIKPIGLRANNISNIIDQTHHTPNQVPSNSLPKLRPSEVHQNETRHQFSKQNKSLSDLKSSTISHDTIVNSKSTTAKSSLENFFLGAGCSSSGSNLDAPNTLNKPQFLRSRHKHESSVVEAIANRFSWNGSVESFDDEKFNTESIPVNKKLEIWRRRWKKAEKILNSRGVKLRAWKVGGDVCSETLQMIEKKVKEIKTGGLN